MSGLVEELHELADEERGLTAEEVSVMRQAADEITSLRASVLGLEGALRAVQRNVFFELAYASIGPEPSTLRDISEIISAALLPKELDHAG